METEEVEDIILMAQDQEDERIKKGEERATKKALEYIASEGSKAPRGKRRETMQQIIGDR